MGTFTHLDRQALAAIADAFGLGRLSEASAITAGTINSNFALRTAGGAFFARINEGKSRADVQYEAELVCALNAAGVPTPAPLRARDGRPFAELDGRLVSVFPWLAGAHRSMADMSPSDTALVGAALARLHLAGAPLAARFERPGIYTFPDIVARFHGFRDRPDPALQPVVPALASAIAEIEAQAAQRERAARGVIHADLFPDNVIFTPGPEPGIALIDFEQACTGSLLYDLAVCLTSWCYRDDFVAELVRAMVAGYRQVRPLDASDLDLLHLEARVAAVRFTVTRITDIHLAGVDNPAKDFRRYAARLASLRALGSDGFAALVGRCD